MKVRPLSVFFLAAAAAVLVWLCWPAEKEVTARAKRLILEGKVDAAEQLLAHQLDAHPDDHAARYLLATLFADTQPGEALLHLSLIGEEFDRVAEARRQFQQIIGQLETQGRAAAVLEELNTRFPENLVLMRALTGVLIRAHQGKKAFDVAEQMVARHPDDIDALLLLADACDEIGRRTGMVAPLQHVLELSPDSYIAHANLAYALRFSNELESAEKHARWCLDRNPSDEATRIQLALTLRDTGEIENALAECRQVSQQNPRHLDARILEAEMLLFQRKYDDVVACLTPVRELAHDHPQIQSLLDRALTLKQQPGADAEATRTGQTSQETAASIQFRDVAAELGVTFRHWSPLTPERHLHLVMGSGVAWFDFDRDGWSDLLFGQGRPFDTEAPLARDANATDIDQRARDCLLRNIDGTELREATALSDLGNPDYSMGIACGDWNNDGFTDVFVSSFGPNRLFQNQGDGTFADVSHLLPNNGDLFSASATWGDINGDGAADLFVTNYIAVDPYDYKICHVTHAGREHTIGCHPHFEPALLDAVSLGDGAGGFSAAADSLFEPREPARQGLGVVGADLDRDGDQDFFVANDTVENQLWINEAGVLQDRASISGVAANRLGEREAGMGVAVGDLTGNGFLDLFVTHFFYETNTLYRNEGGLLFLDATDESGLGPPSRLRLGFGATLLDVDSDGWLDLFVANGHIHTRLEELGREAPFAQKAQMFRNQGHGQFADVSESSGPYFQQDMVGRGTAAADFDRDGRRDIAIQHLNGEPSLLRNETRPPQHWLQIELVGTKCARDAIGALVAVQADGRNLVRNRDGSSSYLSCDDGRVHFAFSEPLESVDLTITWPGGRVEHWSDVSIDRENVIIEGTSEIHRLPLAR